MFWYNSTYLQDINKRWQIHTFETKQLVRDLNKVVKGIIIFLAVVINSNVTFKSNSGGPKED